MSRGLKSMVTEAMAEESNGATSSTRKTKPAKPRKPAPVQMGGNALHAISQYVRQWSGWPDAIVVPGDPSRYGSPWAMTDQVTRTITYNPDTLVLNPNRVLHTVTPFRLRQEAVLTGALLHEAGHARHSKWLPRTQAEAEAKPIKHSTYMNGTDIPTEQCIRLAVLMEESRIEGLMYRDADHIGAASLGWTMRAMAAHTQGTTALSAEPNQQIMDLIDSWAKRAGRQYAIEAWANDYRMRPWVQDFTTLVTSAIVDHLNARLAVGALDCDPGRDANKIMSTLIAMTHVTDDTGPTMVDMARLVLGWLFPETPGEHEDEKPMPSPACASVGQAEPEEDSESESGEDGEGDEEGEDGEGNTEPEDEGEGDEPGAGDAGSEDSDEDGEPDKGEPNGGESPETGDDTDESEGDEGDDTDEDGDEGDDTDEDGEPDEGATSSTEDGDEDGDEDGEEVDTDSPLAEALAAMEEQADGEVEEQAEEEAEEAEAEVGKGAGAGAGGGFGGDYRHPTPEERDIQKGAEKFLRSLVDPGEQSKVTLTDSPSSTVDGAALAAWKAAGQRTDPRFFIRTRREVMPSIPVRIAVLVDVSSSMDALQKPSAVLSWALSAAALDLRNFAGRGQQVESCLIHWGTSAKVIQRNGETLPGIKEHDCDQGTDVMHRAMELVEQEMPGFFEMTSTPVHRLLVQFTDWQLFNNQKPIAWIDRALTAGVNMLSVVPDTYREGGPWGSDLPNILRQCKTQRGRTTMLRYNWARPSEVWEHAAEALIR